MISEEKIRNYILDSFMFTDDQNALSNNDSFMEKGIIDSTGVLELINFLEDEYKIKVEDDELVPENLDSVENILSYLDKKI